MLAPWWMRKSKTQAGQFNPSTVSGLTLWMDPASGLYQDDAATTPAVADGDAVGAWVSRVNSHTFIQATAGSKPTLKRGTNGINSHPVVRCDGTADHLKIASAVLSSSAGSVFAVVRLTSPLQTNETLISSADEASATRFWILRSAISSGTPNMSVVQRDNDTQDQVRGSTAVVAATSYIQTFESSGTAYAYRVNGVAETLVISGGVNAGDWTADTSARDNTLLFALQTSGGVSAFFFGDLAELLVYETQVTSAQRSLIEGYLHTKYRIAFP